MIALVWHLREAELQLRKDIYNGIIRLSERGVYLQYPPSVASEPGGSVPVSHFGLRGCPSPGPGDGHPRPVDPEAEATLAEVEKR